MGLCGGIVIVCICGGLLHKHKKGNAGVVMYYHYCFLRDIFVDPAYNLQLINTHATKKIRIFVLTSIKGAVFIFFSFFFSPPVL